MHPYRTGQVIALACGHPRVVAFNDAHDSGAQFWCGPCDGMRPVGADLATLAHTVALMLDSTEIGTAGIELAAALGNLFDAVSHHRRHELASRQKQLWRIGAIRVPDAILAGLARTEVISHDLGWQSSAALVRRTDTGQHYVVSTNDEETLTWRCDANGSPYMSTDPHMAGYRETVVEAVCGRGLTRSEAIQLIDQSEPGDLVSGYPVRSEHEPEPEPEDTH